MKKTLIYLASALFLITSCKREEAETTTIQEVENIDKQNSNDDIAIAKYLEDHYFDTKGKIVKFSSSSTDDDNYKKLSELNPIKLPSGVVVIVREGAQPTAGKEIGSTDIIRLMHKTHTFLSSETGYTSEATFISTIESTGVPQADPAFYYATPKLLETTGQSKSFYEIEGFQEGLKHFKSFDQSDDAGYNLQGVILVPSRVAFARDSHYAYNNNNLRNRNFVFNFQVYKTSTR